MIERSVRVPEEAEEKHLELILRSSIKRSRLEDEVFDLRIEIGAARL